MIKLKSISLQNYCGYYNVDLNFNKTGTPNRLTVFYGPNGIGKSTFLQAPQLLLPNMEMFNLERFLTTITYSGDADREYQAFRSSELGPLRIAGVFDDNGVEKQNIIENNGFIRREINEQNTCSFVDVDNPTKTRNFQIDMSRRIEEFLEILEVIYGFPVYLQKPTNIDSEMGNTMEIFLQKINSPQKITRNSFRENREKYLESFAQDLVIEKNYSRSPSTKIHFKNMSAGERKIAILFKQLLATNYEHSHIFLIDNIDMHIYFTRHGNVIDKLLQYFPNAQFFLTTHSETMINHVRDNYGEHCLVNLEEIKG